MSLDNPGEKQWQGSGAPVAAACERQVEDIDRSRRRSVRVMWNQQHGECTQQSDVGI